MIAGENYPDRPALAEACLAAIVAPMLAILFLSVVAALLGVGIEAVAFALFVVVLAVPVAAAHVVLLGLPAYLLLRRIVEPSAEMAALAGAVIGVVPLLLLNSLDGGGGSRGNAAGYFLFGLMGLIGGLAFGRSLARHEKGGPFPDRPFDA